MKKFHPIKKKKKNIIEIVESYFLRCFFKGEFKMASNKGLISENLREEIAKELGVFDQVKQDGGWQNVSSKNCGNIVKKAIEIANRSA